MVFERHLWQTFTWMYVVRLFWCTCRWETLQQLRSLLLLLLNALLPRQSLSIHRLQDVHQRPPLELLTMNHQAGNRQDESSWASLSLVFFSVSYLPIDWFLYTSAVQPMAFKAISEIIGSKVLVLSIISLNVHLWQTCLETSMSTTSLANYETAKLSLT